MKIDKGLREEKRKRVEDNVKNTFFKIKNLIINIFSGLYFIFSEQT